MTYEYKCDACNATFTRDESIKSEPNPRCVSCKKHAARRMISSGNFVLKGSGWAADGYS